MLEGCFLAAFDVLGCRRMKLWARPSTAGQRMETPAACSSCRAPRLLALALPCSLTSHSLILSFSRIHRHRCPFPFFLSILHFVSSLTVIPVILLPLAGRARIALNNKQQQLQHRPCRSLRLRALFSPASITIPERIWTSLTPPRVLQSILPYPYDSLLGHTQPSSCLPIATTATTVTWIGHEHQKVME